MNEMEKALAAFARPEAPAYVEEALLREFRRAHSPRRRLGRAVSGAIAAALLFLCALSFTRPAPPRPEISTRFYALPGNDPLERLDRGRLVRVRLPRPALRAFGFPMNEDRAFETVKADVILGEDGLARAIRFVGE
jgi:hypothetical protein